MGKQTEFGKLLVKEREKRGMNRGEFADFLNINERSLQSYELGDRRPELNHYERILNKLGYVIEIRKAE